MGPVGVVKERRVCGRVREFRVAGFNAVGPITWHGDEWTRRRWVKEQSRLKKKLLPFSFFIFLLGFCPCSCENVMLKKYFFFTFLFFFIFLLDSVPAFVKMSCLVCGIYVLHIRDEIGYNLNIVISVIWFKSLFLQLMYHLSKAM